MRNSKDYLIITFPTTTMAMFMEKKCKEKGKEGRIIPLPKSISAGCGLVWATQDYNNQAWMDFMNEEKITFELMERVDV